MGAAVRRCGGAMVAGARLEQWMGSVGKVAESWKPGRKTAEMKDERL